MQQKVIGWWLRGGSVVDTLQRLLTQVFPSSSELVPSGQVVSCQLTPVRPTLDDTGRIHVSYGSYFFNDSNE